MEQLQNHFSRLSSLKLHPFTGTSDTAHLPSKYREQHSGIFPASGKASCTAIKYSHFLWKTATYIYETSMQIPCNIQFKFTFLSDTKYRIFFSVLYLLNWPWLHSTEERTTTKKDQKTHTTILDIPVLSSSSTQAKETNCTGTNLGVRESTWEPVCHQLKKLPTGNKCKEIKVRARMLNMPQTCRK